MGFFGFLFFSMVKKDALKNVIKNNKKRNWEESRFSFNLKLCLKLLARAMQWTNGGEREKKSE